MPAWRLDDENRKVCQYDVGAIDGEMRGFIAHAVLCVPSDPHNVNRNQRSVEIAHMGPPLERGQLAIDAIGNAAVDEGGLAPAERRQIKMFVDDRLAERKAQGSRLSRVPGSEARFAEYVIHPPYLKQSDDVSLWRFSCAGFVLRAYEEAQIHLIDLGNLPVVDLVTLKRAYPRFARLLDRQDLRKKLGIAEGEAWPVVLVGYLMHSLSRSRSEIMAGPYVAEKGDEFFRRDNA